MFQTQRVQWNKTYSTIALAKSAMELHSWEMEFSIQYHVRDHKHPIKRSELNKVLYKYYY
jgi:hypothetical protein